MSRALNLNIHGREAQFITRRKFISKAFFRTTNSTTKLLCPLVLNQCPECTCEISWHQRTDCTIAPPYGSKRAASTTVRDDSLSAKTKTKQNTGLNGELNRPEGLPIYVSQKVQPLPPCGITRYLKNNNQIKNRTTQQRAQSARRCISLWLKIKKSRRFWVMKRLPFLLKRIWLQKRTRLIRQPPPPPPPHPAIFFYRTFHGCSRRGRVPSRKV